MSSSISHWGQPTGVGDRLLSEPGHLIHEAGLAGQAYLKPTTRERYAGIVRKHIRPRWATTMLADVTHAEVQSWVTTLTRSAEPATVRKIHRVLSPILTLAVRDGRLLRNPATDI